MLSQNSKFFYVLLLSGILIIFSFSYNIYKEVSEAGKCNRSNNFIDGLGGSISLIDQNEKSFSLEEKDITLSLVYFGYSYCPDICPYDLERNAYVKDMMDEAHVSGTKTKKQHYSKNRDSSDKSKHHQKKRLKRKSKRASRSKKRKD